jgi:hypothetical protein
VLFLLKGNDCDDYDCDSNNDNNNDSNDYNCDTDNDSFCRRISVFSFSSTSYS